MNSISGVSLRELQYLVAVAKTQHFGDAAIECSVTQSTLSGQLRKLESYLGQPLIDRNKPTKVLTPFGEIVAQHAYKIIDEVQLILDAAHRES